MCGVHVDEIRYELNDMEIDRSMNVGITSLMKNATFSNEIAYIVRIMLDLSTLVIP